ncbi:MAG: glycosyltransferase [Gammaproteobacteria bacterium]|nr:glycosyltransferase [Gammaproteobacteria bacterium]
MKLSIVIPAYNEERYLPACLASVHRAVEANGDSSLVTEIIVADNNSTDRTAEIAQASGALVAFEPQNQIARARNAGATMAAGDWLLFLDADCELNDELLRDTLEVICSGKAVGCGSVVAMPDLPRWAAHMLAGWNRISRRLRWAAGSFLVCRADAFQELGGFNTTLYAAEEIDLSRRLKRWGRKRGLRFEILDAHPLVSSNRKLRLYSAREIAWQTLRLFLWPFGTLRNRNALSVWYDGRR